MTNNTQAITLVFAYLFILMGIVTAALSLKITEQPELEFISNIARRNADFDLREKQLGCLATNIYHEAGNEPFDGKVAVAQVTLNRVISGKFASDICGVIYQKKNTVCQFSWVCSNVSAPSDKAMYDESMYAAKRVFLDGYRIPSLSEGLFYHADYIDPNWNREKIMKIGHHVFYK